MKNKILVVFAALFLASTSVGAQDFAVKTNLLYDATATVNAGIEVGLAPRWTFDLSGNINAWTIKDMKWKHWLAQPEVRYWFCDRFQGHFLGVHGIGAAYNVGFIPSDIQPLSDALSNYRYQGYAYGGGIAYGYAWALSRHLNLEFELGVGYVYTEYDKFECDGCGKMVGKDVPLDYIGPTKAAINLVYVF